jgi:protein tyrosine phosphatase
MCTLGKFRFTFWIVSQDVFSLLALVIASFFCVSLQEVAQPRRIYQFHYTGWPNYGVPDDPSSVLNTLEDVNIKQDDTGGAGPIVVHCRWGTIGMGGFCEGYSAT